MPEHGGNLAVARALYAHVQAPWIDLSTGINPRPYPIPSVPDELWARLPQPEPALVAAACAYYGAPQLLAVPGSQAAIRAVPLLIPPARVLMPALQYSEHAVHWRAAGHQVKEVAFNQLENEIDRHDWLVLCNPNNPTGERCERHRLLGWLAHLRARGGGLLVDEAFADLYPELSLAEESQQPGLIVLRSFGKFFGLAGARVGFVLANPFFLARLQHQLGPWALSGPAQYIALQALLDRAWQRHAARTLLEDGQRLSALLDAHGLRARGAALFQSWEEPRARALQHFFAKHGLWLRAFDNERIRIGLPPDTAAWERLAQVLNEWRKQSPHAQDRIEA